MSQAQITSVSTRGFTLLELMTALGIVGILAAIAIPNYQDYVQRSRRTAAVSALLQAAQVMERDFVMNNQYNAARDLSAYNKETNDKYTLAINSSTASASYYEIIATPNTGGDECGALSIDSNGVKKARDETESAIIRKCWLQ